MSDQPSYQTRIELKEGLAQLPEKNQIVFKRMYSPDHLDADINDVVDAMPEDKLDWAVQQVQNSIDKDMTDLYREQLLKLIDTKKLNRDLKILGEVQTSIGNQNRILRTYIRMKFMELLPKGTKRWGATTFYVKNKGVEWSISIELPTYQNRVWRIIRSVQGSGKPNETWAKFPPTTHPDKVIQGALNRVAVERFAFCDS